MPSRAVCVFCASDAYEEKKQRDVRPYATPSSTRRAPPLFTAAAIRDEDSAASCAPRAAPRMASKSLSALPPSPSAPLIAAAPTFTTREKRGGGFASDGGPTDSPEKGDGW